MAMLKKIFVWLPFVVVVGITLSTGLLTGCRSIPVPVEHTFTRKDSVILREKLVPFSIQETTINKSFSREQVDSIIMALKSMPINSRTIYYTDPKFKTQMSFMLDSLGRLIIGCKTLEQEYQFKITEQDRYIKEQEKIIQELKRSPFEKFTNFINNGLWSIVIVLILVVAIALIIKRNGN